MTLNKTKINIKNRIYNSSLKSGNKKTGEKNLLKSLKNTQKLSYKNHIKILTLAIKNTTPALKMNKQKMKRRKRKAIKEIPTFLQNNSLRINLSLKYLLINSTNRTESEPFYNKFSKEVIDSAILKSSTVNQIIDFQKKILLQKSYFFKYRWKK